MSPEVGVALRLDFFRSQAELRAARVSSEQFVLNAERAIELGEELARLGRAAIAGRSRN